MTDFKPIMHWPGNKDSKLYQIYKGEPVVEISFNEVHNVYAARLLIMGLTAYSTTPEEAIKRLSKMLENLITAVYTSGHFKVNK